MGDLDLASVVRLRDVEDLDRLAPEGDFNNDAQLTTLSDQHNLEPEPIDPETYCPDVSSEGVWTLSETDVGEC